MQRNSPRTNLPMPARLSIPTKARLPSTLKVNPTTPIVQRILNRLSRPALITLALDWLEERNLALTTPFLRHPHDSPDLYVDDFYPPCDSIDELRDTYSQLLERSGAKREIVDRIVEGDWRHGLSLYQIAMADIQYIYDHPSFHRWMSYEILPLRSQSVGTGNAEQQREAEEEFKLEVDKKSLDIPRVHPSTFLEKLQAAVLPDVKAHYQFERPVGLPLLLLRIFIIDSPYNTSRAISAQRGSLQQRIASTTAAFDSSKTIFIAFPDGAPYLYISNTQSNTVSTSSNSNSGEAKSLYTLVIQGIPKALSKSRQRYTLKHTNLTTRNFAALLRMRGAGRTNHMNGGWSIYNDSEGHKDTPLERALPPKALAAVSDNQNTSSGPKEPDVSSWTVLKRPGADPVKDGDANLARKRARIMAQARFGNSAQVTDGIGLERVEIFLQDPYSAPTASSSSSSAARQLSINDVESLAGTNPHRPPQLGSTSAAGDKPWVPKIKLTFQGPHVFAGIRQLVEAGVIDGKRMPGWMTGEDAVTTGLVRNGRIRGTRGSGLR